LTGGSLPALNVVDLRNSPILLPKALGAKVTRILGRLICIVFAFVVVAGSANAYTVTSAEEHFTAVFPGEPKLTKSTDKTTSGVPYNTSSWVLGNSDNTKAWFVEITDYSTPVKNDYAAVISGAVAGVKGGKLVSQKTIRHGGVEGREILVDIAGSNEGRERIFWIGNRLFQILFVGKTGTSSAPDVDAFLNSFQATK
jgi:hypothetical protein